MGFFQDFLQVVTDHPEAMVVFGITAASLAVILLFSRLNEDLSRRIAERTQVLNRTNRQLEKVTRLTEKQVRERTKELDANVKKLSETDAALMNMISDLNRVNKELRTLDAMKDEFLNVTTHELKTPITPIKIQSQLWLDGAYGRISKEQRHSFEIVLRNAERLSNLIDDLTTISKLQTQKLKFNFRKTRVDRLVKQVVSDYQRQAQKKKIRLGANLPNRLSPVLGDEQRLLQVLANLVDNAVKFTERGNVTVSAEHSGDQVIVRVADTGIGIPEQASHRLFSKFFQADQSITRKYGGTGLGLAICKAIVEKHGGEIGFSSAPGKGTTFSFSLPLFKKRGKKKG